MVYARSARGGQWCPTSISVSSEAGKGVARPVIGQCVLHIEMAMEEHVFEVCEALELLPRISHLHGDTSQRHFFFCQDNGQQACFGQLANPGVSQGLMFALWILSSFEDIYMALIVTFTLRANLV